MHKKKCMVFFSVFMCLILFFVSGCGGTSSETTLPAGSDANDLTHGRIQGTIIASDTGQVIENAIVETYQTQAITGQDGRYLLGPVAAGDYRLVARATGYSPIIKEGVRVFPGKITENQNFRMSSEVSGYDPEFSVLAILPEVGTDNDIVSIFCRGCGTDAGKVTFNGKEAQILDWNSARDEKITVKVPEQVETGPVKVIINGQESKEIQSRLFIGRPVILEARPATAQGGQIITLHGRNFNEITRFNKVRLADIECTTISVADTHTMQIQLPRTAKTGMLSIRIESNEYQLDGFSDVIVTIKPELVHLSPRRSIPKVPLTLYGYSFGEDRNSVKIIFGRHIIQPNDLLSFSDNKISFAAPDNSVIQPGQSVEIKVQVNESQSNPLTYTAYNRTNNTISDYGIYDFRDVSDAAGTLKLECLKPTDRMVFLSVLSADSSLDMEGTYYYNISAFMGGNFSQVPNLPASRREYVMLPPDTSTMQSNRILKSKKPLRAALSEPASQTIEVYIRDFLSSDPWDHNNDILATGTLKASDSVSLVYFDVNISGLTDEDAVEIAERFNGIYNTVATACRDAESDPPEGDIDAQPRIALFMSPLLEQTPGAEKISSYFDIRDKDPAAPNSAGTEILYLNSETFLTNENDFYGGMAQTLSYMIYNNQKGLYVSDWQGHGLSTFARQEAGYGYNQGDTRAINWVSQYLQYPELVSLNHWPEQPGYQDYGMAFLFTQYLFDRCGEYNAIQVLESDNGFRGILDVDNNIIRAGMANPPSISLREFFHDFCLALFCDSLNLPDSLTGYDKEAFSFRNIRLRGQHAGVEGLKGLALNENPVSNSTMSLKGYGCRLLGYQQGNWGDIEVTINSVPADGDFRTWVIFFSTEY